MSVPGTKPESLPLWELIRGWCWRICCSRCNASERKGGKGGGVLFCGWSWFPEGILGVMGGNGESFANPIGS